MERIETTVIGRPCGRHPVGATLWLTKQEAALLQVLGRVRLADVPQEQQYATRHMVAGAPPVPVKRGRGRPRKYPLPAA